MNIKKTIIDKAGFHKVSFQKASLIVSDLVALLISLILANIIYGAINPVTHSYFNLGNMGIAKALGLAIIILFLIVDLY